MGEKLVVVRYCDRCKRARATRTVRYTYRGSDFEVDVCEAHFAVLDRMMSGWIGVSRERTVRPYAVAAAPARPAPAPAAPTAEVEPTISSKLLESIAADREVRAKLDAEAKAAEPTIELPGVVELRPTRNIESQLAAYGIAWSAVVEAVANAKNVLPDKKEGVSIYQDDTLSVRVSEDRSALSLLVRQPEREWKPRPIERPAARPVRKGKRGGIGSRGPKSYVDVLEAIRNAPGWVLVLGGKHYQARGPKGQLVSLSVTPSDYRAVDNAIAQLRNAGLDLRKTS